MKMFQSDVFSIVSMFMTSIHLLSYCSHHPLVLTLTHVRFRLTVGQSMIPNVTCTIACEVIQKFGLWVQSISCCCYYFAHHVSIHTHVLVGSILFTIMTNNTYFEKQLVHRPFHGSELFLARTLPLQLRVA